jgi:hypothetical protein
MKDLLAFRDLAILKLVSEPVRHQRISMNSKTTSIPSDQCSRSIRGTRFFSLLPIPPEVFHI